MNDGTRFSANEALRRIFVLKDRVTGVWRKLHNEELNSVYSSPNIIRVIKIKKNLYRNCVTRGREERSKQGLGVGGGGPEGKRPGGLPKRRWEHNVKNGYTRS